MQTRCTVNHSTMRKCEWLWHQDPAGRISGIMQHQSLKVDAMQQAPIYALPPLPKSKSWRCSLHGTGTLYRDYRTSGSGCSAVPQYTKACICRTRPQCNIRWSAPHRVECLHATMKGYQRTLEICRKICSGVSTASAGKGRAPLSGDLRCCCGATAVAANIHKQRQLSTEEDCIHVALHEVPVS